MINLDFGLPFPASYSPKQLLSDQSSRELLMAIQLCAEQSHNLLAYAHSPPLPPSMEQFALPQTGRLSYRSPHSPTPTTTGPVDFQLAPIRLGQSRKSIRGSGSTHNNQTLTSNHYQNQPLQGFVCGWSPELEPGPVSPRVPSVPVQSPSMLQVANTYRNTGQSEPWMNFVFGGDMDTSPPSSDCADLSASAFLHSFNDYDFPAAKVGPQQSRPGGSNLGEFVPSLCVAREPTDGSDRSQRASACRWLADGALCNLNVMPDRRSVVEHLQKAHGVKPGDEKAREPCYWERCKTTLNKESLARHILTVHLKEGARCPDCAVVFAREDSLKRHLKSLHEVPLEKHGTRQSPT